MVKEHSDNERENPLLPHGLLFRIRKEGNVLFNDALNTFYLRLYGITYMVKDHSDSKRGNLLLPHGLLFPSSLCGGSGFPLSLSEWFFTIKIMSDAI